MNKEKTRKIDLIRDSKNIKLHVIEAIKRKNYTHKDIIDLAEKDKVSIDGGAFSRWLKDDTSQRSILSQDQVIWLCKKLRIDITLGVKFKGKNELDPK